MKGHILAQTELMGKYCDGDNISPPLSWSGAPQGTKSFALIMHLRSQYLFWECSL